MERMNSGHGNKGNGNVSRGAIPLSAAFEIPANEAFDQYFPRVGVRLDGSFLPIFLLEKPGILAEN
jgi:hypothetical protein